MKLPNQIVTRNKIRDAKILRMYAQDNMTMEEIGLKFGVTQPNIYSIIYKNRHLLSIDRDYEKTKRINHLNRLLKNNSEKMGTKTAPDLIDQLRVETEGNKLEVNGNIEHNIFIEEVVKKAQLSKSRIEQELIDVD